MTVVKVRSLLNCSRVSTTIKSQAKAWFPVLAGLLVGMIVGSQSMQSFGTRMEPARQTSSSLFSGVAYNSYLQPVFDETISEAIGCLEVGDTSSSRTRPPSDDVANCLLDIPSDNYFRLLSDVLVGLPLAGRCNVDNGCQPPHAPYDENARKFGDDWPPYGYTMIGKERLKNFRAAILEVNRNRVPGAIAEFGVWRGGAMIMAAAIQRYDPSSVLPRDLYLFDAYGSFGKYEKANDFLAVPLPKVQEAFEVFGLNDDNIHFVQGLFSDTVKEWIDRKDPIAVLRVDGNFYASYQDVLYAVYENVPVGGVVIFDDVMSHTEVMRCWNDFKHDQGIPEELVRIDRHSAWFRKTTDVKIDQSKKRQAYLN